MVHHINTIAAMHKRLEDFRRVEFKPYDGEPKESLPYLVFAGSMIDLVYFHHGRFQNDRGHYDPPRIIGELHLKE